MKVNEKIKFLRESKRLSQEEMANKLGMSTNGYAKIERGETRLNIPKLEQIVNILDMDIIELMSVGERNVVLFQESDSNINIIGSSHGLTFELAQLKTELAQLKTELAHKEELLKHKNEIIEMQRKEIARLNKLLGEEQ